MINEINWERNSILKCVNKLMIGKRIFCYESDLWNIYFKLTYAIGCGHHHRHNHFPFPMPDWTCKAVDVMLCWTLQTMAKMLRGLVETARESPVDETEISFIYSDSRVWAMHQLILKLALYVCLPIWCSYALAAIVYWRRNGRNTSPLFCFNWQRAFRGLFLEWSIELI